MIEGSSRIELIKESVLDSSTLVGTSSPLIGSFISGMAFKETGFSPKTIVGCSSS